LASVADVAVRANAVIRRVSTHNALVLFVRASAVIEAVAAINAVVVRISEKIGGVTLVAVAEEFRIVAWLYRRGHIRLSR
jgi:hypothetical protein